MAVLTEIDIANMALSHIGVSQQLVDVDGTIANSTDTSTQFEQCALWYPRVRALALAEFPFRFARKAATLVLSDTLEDDSDIYGDEWDSAYVYPSDCLTLRRFIGDQGFGFWSSWGIWPDESVWPWPGELRWRFIVRRIGTARVILTDVPEDDARMEYTEDLTTASAFPETFGHALSWYLAAKLAMPLSNDPRKAQAALSMYRTEAARAAAYSSNEELPRPKGDGGWISSRGGY